MNTDTGRLVDLNQYDELKTAFEKDGKSLKEIMQEQNLTQVPEKLKAEAEKCLGDKSEVMVDMTKDTALTRWAKTEQQRKKKNKRKIAQKSHRRNR